MRNPARCAEWPLTLVRADALKRAPLNKSLDRRELRRGPQDWIIFFDDSVLRSAVANLRIPRHSAGLLSFPDRLSAGVLQPAYERGGARFVGGHPVRYWFKPSGKRNEALDRRVYALAALHARPVPWEVLLRAAPAEPVPRPPAPPEGSGPPAPSPSSPLPPPASRFELRRIRFRMR
jgi:phage terminase large subunit GpA-like protein